MTYFPWSLLLMGLSAFAVGVVGSTLPPGRKLEALLALVAGAGAGVVVLGVGLVAGLDGTSPTTMETLFFAGSCVGTVAAAAVLLLVRRRKTAGP